MSMRINTNVAAMNALRNLGNTATEFNKSINRLSTGLRIINAADDPAGLIISEGLRAQIAGLDQAVRNSQDGVNLVKTAEGALDEVNKLLRDARGLALQSGNTGVQDTSSIQAIQNQLSSIISSVNRIQSNTQFGNKKLLDGSAGVTGSVVNTSNVEGIQLSGTFNGSAIASGTITLQQTQAAAKAVVNSSTVTYTAASVKVAAGTVVVNGVSISTDGTESLSAFVQKINAQSTATGVTANIDGTGTTLNVSFTQNNFGADYQIKINDSKNLLLTSITATTVSGTDAIYSVSAVVSSGSATSVATVAFTGGRNAGDGGLRLTDTYGNSVLLSETGNGATTAFLAGVATAGNVSFQVGANANQGAVFSLNNVHASQLGNTVVSGKSLSSIDVTQAGGSDEAVKIIDEAISQVSKMRGDIGSFQRNVLESNIRSLSVAKENLAATESTIRDADVAEEMTKFTKFQILQQSGLSVLAQANAAPQSVLSLLR